MASILIADSDPGVRDFLRRVLEGAGHEVREASDGKGAMARIGETSFDVVILALVMPDQDGLGTLRALRRDQSSLRIIATSGSFSDPQTALLMQKMAEALGAKAILQKPLTAPVALETVQKVLGSQ